MAAFLVRRALQAIVVLLIVTMITFALLRMIPGNVAIAVMGPNAYRDPGAIRVFNADYGFNLPLYRQYFLWLDNLLQSRLGLRTRPTLFRQVVLFACPVTGLSDRLSM